MIETNGGWSEIDQSQIDFNLRLKEVGKYVSGVTDELYCHFDQEKGAEEFAHYKHTVERYGAYSVTRMMSEISEVEHVVDKKYLQFCFPTERIAAGFPVYLLKMIDEYTCREQKLYEMMLTFNSRSAQCGDPEYTYYINEIARIGSEIEVIKLESKRFLSAYNAYK